jgi:D-xylonolactonase
MENPEVTFCAGTAGALLGEGPLWDSREQALYWLDIKGLAVHRRDYESGEVRSWRTPFRIGSLARRRSGGFIGGSERGILAIDLDRNAYSVLAAPEPDRPTNRSNDGKVDRAGSFWAGTMDDAEIAATGALYRFDADLSCERIDDGYLVTNGPAFSPDGRTIYHTDSARQQIYRFDLSLDGRVGERRLFAQFGPDEGYPDGMTVDAEGCLWVAFWDGWCVRRLAPTGKRIAEIAMPVQRPTSCAFGGPQLDTLFVTSAAIGLDSAALADQPRAGGLFTVQPGATGIAEMPFAG